MSASFSIASSTGSYDVTVATGSLSRALEGSGETHVIADQFFRGQLESSRTQPGHAPLLIEASETEKSLDRMPSVVEAMRAAGANRRTLLVAVGGGVIQDIAAFVASVYMRGLDWHYVPTTVLAMVDSCIGGKSSINVGPYKNLVGTFHPPQQIYIDPALAETLPRDQFASGLIEAVKICFCHSAASFARHLSFEPSTTMSTAALEQVIVNSLLAKKHFIEIDEFDQKERLLLNFGHTFGHAIEGASHYGIPHGIAVGLGILCSLAFQRQRGIDYTSTPQVAQLEQHLRAMIAMLPGVSEQLHALPLQEVLERFASDKKHTRDRFTLILVAENGTVVLEQIAKTPALEAAIRQAITSTIESYTT